MPVALGDVMSLAGIRCFSSSTDIQSLFAVQPLSEDNDPWMAPRPDCTNFGLPEAGNNFEGLDTIGRGALDERRQCWFRLAGAVLVPSCALAALISVGLLPIFPERLEALVIFLAFALVSLMGLWLHGRESLAAAGTLKAIARYRAALGPWTNEQRRRTQLEFWDQGISAIARSRLKKANSIEPTKKAISSKRGEVFAHEVGMLLRAQGWGVEVNQQRDDGGVDLFACAPGKSVVLQCKHYIEGAAPEPADVRELVGSAIVFGADAGYLVSIKFPAENPRTKYFVQNSPVMIGFANIGHLLQIARRVYQSRTGMSPEPDLRASELEELVGEDGATWDGIAMDV